MADLFVYRPDSMPGSGPQVLPHQTEFRFMRLYCWPCRSTHEFGLKDVEKIVYALGAAEVLALELGGDAGLTTECAELAAAGPSCLETVLEVARDGDAYREHVEQGIECRERSDG